MISVWWLLTLIPVGFLCFVAAGCLSHGSEADDINEAYFAGVKKGHQDMQERFGEMLRDKKAGRMAGNCAKCGATGRHKQQEGPLICDGCEAEISRN